MKELYLVGRILKPRGLKGEVKVLPITDYPESFLERKAFHVGRDEEYTAVRQVLKSELRKGYAYLLFEGMDTREKAEEAVGSKLYVTPDELVPLPSDRAYLHELKGLKIINESFDEVGTVLDVLNMPAHDVYEIEYRGKRIIVPAVEEFVEEIRIEKGYMVLKRLDEFL